MSKDLTLKNTKGVTAMNSTTPEEQIKKRKDVIEFVQELKDKSIRYGDIVKAVMQKFSFTDRWAKQHIKFQKESSLKRLHESQESGKADMIDKLWFLHKKAMEINSFKEAREILAEISKLQGYQAEKKFSIKTEVTAKTDLSHLSLEEKMKLRDMLTKPNNTIDITHEEV
jgi:hypothetical protein